MRNSPPIHTCSEHAQGPSKPPAVVRKLWSECALLCAWSRCISSKMATWKQGLGRRWCGAHRGWGAGIHLSFCDIMVPGYIHQRSQIRLCWSQQALGLLQWEDLPTAAARRMQVSKGKGQRDSGMLNFVLTEILVRANYPGHPHVPNCVHVWSLVSDG